MTQIICYRLHYYSSTDTERQQRLEQRTKWINYDFSLVIELPR